jgi:C-8 sterol isomerase
MELIRSYRRLYNSLPSVQRFGLLSITVGLLALFIGLAVDNYKQPVFDVKTLQNIVDRSLAAQHQQQLNLTATINLIQLELSLAYPAHIWLQDPQRDVLTNLAGGFKTGMILLHGSLTEYIMFWGTQVGTVGHSGRNWAQFNDWLISGTGLWWPEGSLAVKEAKRGSYVFTEKFHGGIVRLEKETWMLEYCHGIIPALLPFGLADSLVSSLDPVTLYHSIVNYGKMTLYELFVNWKI